MSTLYIVELFAPNARVWNFLVFEHFFKELTAYIALFTSFSSLGNENRILKKDILLILSSIGSLDIRQLFLLMAKFVIYTIGLIQISKDFGMSFSM
jgi:hypothetical protein